jgi:sigma-B regulation protein RsbU (phosphoserine phosphatase)
MLNTFANHAVVAIENALYFKDSIEKKDLEKELAVAKKIQETLFPKQIPDFRSVEIAALNLPCREIGGDYYDLLKINDDKLGLAIADVSGKGIPASLLMANLQACLRTLTKANLSSKDIVSRINNLIYENTDEAQYITFFYGELDAKEHKLTYCNAGHNPPILLRNDEPEILLNKGGTVLGWIQNLEYREEEISIHSGDEIILYTDGVTEAINHKDEAFEEWRLKKVLKENAKKPPKIIVDQIINEIKIHIAGSSQTDDLTLVIIKIQ